MVIGLAVAILLAPPAPAAIPDPVPAPGLVAGNRERQSSLKSCYARLLRRQGTSARIQVAISFDGAGAVTGVRVAGPRDLSEAAACVKTVVQRWAMPARGEPFEITIPLIFQSGSD